METLRTGIARKRSLPYPGAGCKDTHAPRLRSSPGLERAVSAMSRPNENPGACGSGALLWWVGLRLLIFPAPVAAGLQKSERGPCSSSAVSAAGSASLAQQSRTRTSRVCYVQAKRKPRSLWLRGFVVVGRVALADFSCARRRGLAKIRARPLLRLACFVRWTRLGCAAVQDSNGSASAMSCNKKPKP